MYRILLILGLLVALYFLLRNAFRGFKENRGRRGTLTEQGQMVQDPVCGVFVPRESAVTETVRGERHYFCSRDCASAFRDRAGS
jgi:YHS domain-containing protein